MAEKPQDLKSKLSDVAGKLGKVSTVNRILKQTAEQEKSTKKS